MSTIDRRLESWKTYRNVTQDEANRRAVLNGPVPKNPDYLTRLVRARVSPQPDGVSFLIGNGASAVPGDIIELEFHFARDLARAGRVEIVEP